MVPLDAAAVARIDADLAARHEDALDRARHGDGQRPLPPAGGHARARPPRRRRSPTPRCSRRSPSCRGSWPASGIGWPTAGAACRAPASSTRRRPTTSGTRFASGPSARGTRPTRPRRRSDPRRPTSACALAAVTDVLGAHQDAAVAADTWLGIALADPDDHALAITAGRLIERERAAVIASRRDYPRRGPTRRRTVDRMVAMRLIRSAGGVVWRPTPDPAACRRTAALGRRCRAPAHVPTPSRSRSSTATGTTTGRCRRASSSAASTRSPRPSARSARRPASTAIPQVRLPSTRYLTGEPDTEKSVDFWAMQAAVAVDVRHQRRGRRIALARTARRGGSADLRPRSRRGGRATPSCRR